jgi:hypothetical protein
VGATEKVHKAQAKEYEKVFKVSSQDWNVQEHTLSVIGHPSPSQGRPPL